MKNAGISLEIQDLLKDIIQLYQEKKRNKKISERIHRGRAPSIASDFEERFAVLLERVLPAKYSFFVDYPISYKIADRSRKKTSYPDIAIIEDDSVLTGIVELKIDLGYLAKDWITKTKTEFDHLSKAGIVQYTGGTRTEKRIPRTLRVAPTLRRVVVVLSDQNHHGRLANFLRQDNCFILSHKIHPNDVPTNDSVEKAFLQNMTRDQDIEKFTKFLYSFR